MLNDSITEEIRDIRRRLASQFDNDVSRILADARQREASDGRTYVTLPKRPVRPELAEAAHAPEPAAGQASGEAASHAAH